MSRTVPRISTTSAMCRPVTAQTCGRAKVRRLSLRPTTNSSRVIPRSASFWSISPLAIPNRLSTNPAARNPTRGGSPMALDSRPIANATAIHAMSPSAMAIHTKSIRPPLRVNSSLSSQIVLFVYVRVHSRTGIHSITNHVLPVSTQNHGRPVSSSASAHATMPTAGLDAQPGSPLDAASVSCFLDGKLSEVSAN